MTDDELNAMQALADAATKGPWESYGDTGALWQPCSVRQCDDYDGPGIEICEAVSGANAAFIGAARSFVPQAIAEIRRLKAELAVASDWRDRWAGISEVQEQAWEALKTEMERLRALVEAAYLEGQDDALSGCKRDWAQSEVKWKLENKDA